MRRLAEQIDRREVTGFSLVDSKRNINGVVLIRRSEWDSEHFGFNISKVELALFNQNVNANLRLALIRRVIESSVSKLIIARVPLTDIRTIQAFEINGAILTDVLLTFHRDLREIPISREDCRGIEILEADEKHTQQISKIAKDVFTTSHFHSDLFLPANRCSELYAKWALNSLRELADIVLVAKEGNNLLGFVTCRIDYLNDEYSYGVIDLIGVKKEHQGRGIGSCLLNEALRWFSRRTSSVYVGTQANNVRSVRLYEGASFKNVFAEATLHIWRASWWLDDQ
ncbi:MAG: GNAT family N-acetyltransferase [Candidatus Bathyarchaeia archaeon]